MKETFPTTLVPQKDRQHTDNIDDKAQMPTSRKGRKLQWA